MTHIMFGTLNLREYGRSDDPDELRRYAAIAKAIRAYRPDMPLILAVQELSGFKVTEPITQAWTLAEMAGMRCGLTHSSTAVSFNKAHWSHLGLLWRESAVIKPIPHSRRVPRPRDHDNHLFVEFAAAGRWVQFGTSHLSPFELNGRTDMIRRLAQAARIGDIPTWVGFDFNATAAAKTADGADYDPDPYADLPWHPGFSHQCIRERTPDGAWRHEVDRTAGKALINAGLIDIAPMLDVPWKATAGFPPHADELNMPRRLDLITAADKAAAAATIDYHVEDTPAARRRSDHLLTAVTIDLDMLPEQR